MNTNFLEKCYGTQVFCALEMLSVIVTSATRKLSSLYLGFIFLVYKKKKERGMSHAHASLNSTCLLYVTY